MMLSCIDPKCPEEAIVGDYCIKHFKADHDRRQAVREANRANNEESIPEPSQEATESTPVPVIQKTHDEKICKRCKKDKSKDKKFNGTRQLCNSCAVTIRKYEKAGRPVPEYTGRRGSRKTGKKDVKKASKRQDVDEHIKTAEGVECKDYSPPVITVDFTDYPNMKKRLDEMALKDFRTPEMEALAILDMYIISNEEAK